MFDKGAKARGQKDISRGQERLKTQRFLFLLNIFSAHQSLITFSKLKIQDIAQTRKPPEKFLEV